MAHYMVEAKIESDRAELALSQFLEGLLMTAKWHFKVEELTVFPVD